MSSYYHHGPTQRNIGLNKFLGRRRVEKYGRVQRYGYSPTYRHSHRKSIFLANKALLGSVTFYSLLALREPRRGSHDQKDEKPHVREVADFSPCTQIEWNIVGVRWREVALPEGGVHQHS
jgi:hypothetical protein